MSHFISLRHLELKLRRMREISSAVSAGVGLKNRLSISLAINFDKNQIQTRAPDKLRSAKIAPAGKIQPPRE